MRLYKLLCPWRGFVGGGLRLVLGDFFLQFPVGLVQSSDLLFILPQTELVLGYLVLVRVELCSQLQQGLIQVF